MYPVSFGSDNHSAVHNLIFDAMIRANEGYAKGYGEDDLTEAAVKEIRELFGGNCEVLLVMTGTGANVIALQSLIRSYHSIICSSISHINVDECGAVQKFTQARLETVNTDDGKLTPEMIEPLLAGRGDEHRSQKRVISVSQATEYGTVYTVEELKCLADFAHHNGMYLHIDGARLANAAANLGVSLKEMTYETGVDALSFGGTKNGMMFGEAIVILNPELSIDTIYYRKQATQLFSKMRYIAAQFRAYLKDELWLKNALHSNKMAQYLAERLADKGGISITRKVQGNAVFAVLPEELIAPLQSRYHFYTWNEELKEVRLMCSFSTKEEDIDSFIDDLEKLMD